MWPIVGRPGRQTAWTDFAEVIKTEDEVGVCWVKDVRDFQIGRRTGFGDRVEDREGKTVGADDGADDPLRLRRIGDQFRLAEDIAALDQVTDDLLAPG
jgi:hypothetical protein